MSIFLMHYNRKEGRIIELKRYNKAEEKKAEKRRFKLEKEHYLNGDAGNIEVVLLESESLENLKRTHRRYWPETLKEALSEKSSPI